MSITAASCNYYAATQVAGVPSNPNQVAIFAWVKADSTGAAYRAPFAMAQHQVTEDATRDLVCLAVNGSDAISSRIRAGNATADSENSTFYFWQAAAQNRWTAAMLWLDRSATAADASSYVGRAEATALAATQGTVSGDVSSFTTLLEDFFVLRDTRAIDGTSANEATRSSPKVAHIAVWYGYKPTQADMQSLIDGTNPRDIGGGTIAHYWQLKTAAGGLTDEVGSVTLVPTGGAATSTFDDADNPTVSDPTPPADITGTLDAVQLLNAMAASGAVDIAATLDALQAANIAVFSGSTSQSGSFTTEPIINNTGSVLLNQAVSWSWFASGRIGSLDTATRVEGTGTTDAANGTLTVAVPAGSGLLLVAILNTDATDDAVYYEAGAAA